MPVILVVGITEEVVEELVVAHVVETTAEWVEEVVVANKFAMKMMTLVVGFSMEQLLTNQKKLCYPR